MELLYLIRHKVKGVLPIEFVIEPQKQGRDLAGAING